MTSAGEEATAVGSAAALTLEDTVRLFKHLRCYNVTSSWKRLFHAADAE